jgi:RNA recognition motif-containing protein
MRRRYDEVLLQADETSLANFFSSFGPVTECKIIMDRNTGKSKGYGFVTFQEADTAERVKQTANFFFLGKNVCVITRHFSHPLLFVS